MAKLRSEFTRRDYDELQRAKRLLHDLLPECDKGEQCGIEVDGYRAIIAELQRLFANVESAYFSTIPER